jgi:hypothetical protein
MTRIIIEAVTPAQARLPVYAQEGCGDWFSDRDGNLLIQVVTEGERDVMDRSDLFLIALHELVEAVLCRHTGVPQGAVDAFDMKFIGEGEPGDHLDAPYQRQHRASMMIEHLMAIFLGRYDYGAVE